VNNKFFIKNKEILRSPPLKHTTARNNRYDSANARPSQRALSISAQ